MKKIDPVNINENVIRLIGTDWMLVTAGNYAKFNMMTASWGTMGFLWNRPVVMIFVRPQRYTYGFTEQNDYFTLCFFEERYRKALNVCGTFSGRDVDKVEICGLTPYITDVNVPAFKEARLVLECKKLYSDFLEEKFFKDREMVEELYPKKDFHKLYVAEIVNAWEKE